MLYQSKRLKNENCLNETGNAPTACLLKSRAGIFYSDNDFYISDIYMGKCKFSK